jgi:hypothetical protein
LAKVKRRAKGKRREYMFQILTYFTKNNPILLIFNQNLHLKQTLFSIFYALHNSNNIIEKKIIIDTNMIIIRGHMGGQWVKTLKKISFRPPTPLAK